MVGGPKIVDSYKGSFRLLNTLIANIGGAMAPWPPFSYAYDWDQILSHYIPFSPIIRQGQMYPLLNFS